MKEDFMIVLSVLFFIFFIGCGGGESIYSDSGNSGASDTEISDDNNDTGDTSDATIVPDEDTEDTADAEDSDVSDEDLSDDDSYVPPSGTCEEILYCIAGCADFDDNCKLLCVTYGNDEGQQNYNKWKSCYDTNCASDQTAKCSVEKCPEESSACAVSEDSFAVQPFPAPYGSVDMSADFEYIVKDGFPAGESELIYEAFLTGKISKIHVDPQAASLIFSFVNLTNDGTDDVLEIIQIPMMNDEKTVVNPVSRLTIKTEKATKGEHSIGINSSYDARLEVFKITDDGETICHYALGIGEFTIEDINPVSGNDGLLKVSGNSIELYSPKNIPDFGGDVSEQLGVVSCSLIK